MIQTCLGNNLPAPSTPKKRPDHRARALFLIAAVRIGIFMFLAISGLVALHLLVNQDKVRPFLVDKARTILDSDLDYSRMKLHFLPVPHLDVRNLRLHRPDVFDLKAGELSLYPALLPMLSGRFQIQRLILSDPDIRIHIAANPLSESDAPHFSPFFSEAENAGPVSGLFAFLAGIDPETRFQVRNGRIRLISNHTVKGEISAITLDAARTGDRISLDLAGVSPFTGSFQVSLESLAESTALQGTLTASAINGAAMSSFFPLPQDIRIKDASGSGSLEFRLSHPDVFLARFNLDMPALTLLRNDKPLPFSGITLSGAMGYLDEEWIFSVDTLNAEKPELAFSGTALFRKAPDTGRPALDVRIFTPRLDIETTGTLVKSIAGTSPDLETAFSIARSGTLTDLSCTATLAQNETNWAVDTISARGRLSCGTISIPEIKANFTEMEGDVVYQDTQAAFRQMQGKFQGVRFSNLSAGIDWTDEDARLSLETPSATVDAAVLFPWLTGLEGLSAIRNHVSAMSGKALISRLEIQGPLTDPENWQFMINAAPDSMVLTTPHAPFPVTLQGGELVYRPGVEHSVRMGVRFLDADLILSHESRGIVPPESVSCQVDGTLGQDAVDWVSGLLSVPPYLVIQWPVTLSGLHIQWDGKDAVTLAGSLKAGDDTTLHGNLRCAQDTWQVEDLRFSDPDSSAVISATRHQDAVSLSFSGHIDKKTADRLLRRNEILDGKISGQFTAHLHLEHPALSTLAGTVSGNGLHLAWLKPVSVAVSRFSLSGNGSRMTVSDSELRINKTAIQIKGDIFRKDSAPRMDLALKLDTLDLDWLKGLLDAANASATENETPRTPEVLSGAGGTVQLLADRFQADRFTVSPP
ncbi:AsmA family protein [Desulfosarcina sp. OttesenSCG-928-G10]|nr:AsmA family protein [Desulfosarcina sp. OttesenSCG-928-G10]